ncbi:MAG: hypothetical protein DKT66_17655 [Candidatus Melainabacteria bacterium]|nr:MAG: hypothetical protein DKT66_17655 [Candidatus Melainabacteria bacterium]
MPLLQSFEKVREHLLESAIFGAAAGCVTLVAAALVNGIVMSITHQKLGFLINGMVGIFWGLFVGVPMGAMWGATILNVFQLTRKLGKEFWPRILVYTTGGVIGLLIAYTPLGKLVATNFKALSYTTGILDPFAPVSQWIPIMPITGTIALALFPKLKRHFSKAGNLTSTDTKTDANSVGNLD